MSNIYDISGSLEYLVSRNSRVSVTLTTKSDLLGLWLALLVRELPSKQGGVYSQEYFTDTNCHRPHQVTLINSPSEGKGSPQSLYLWLGNIMGNQECGSVLKPMLIPHNPQSEYFMFINSHTKTTEHFFFFLMMYLFAGGKTSVNKKFKPKVQVK